MFIRIVFSNHNMSNYHTELLYEQALQVALHASLNRIKTRKLVSDFHYTYVIKIKFNVSFYQSTLIGS